MCSKRVTMFLGGSELGSLKTKAFACKKETDFYSEELTRAVSSILAKGSISSRHDAITT